MTTEEKCRIKTNPDVKVARADVVDSLLRPAYLREARQGVWDRLMHV